MLLQLNCKAEIHSGRVLSRFRLSLYMVSLSRDECVGTVQMNCVTEVETGESEFKSYFQPHNEWPRLAPLHIWIHFPTLNHSKFCALTRELGVQEAG